MLTHILLNSQVLDIGTIALLSALGVFTLIGGYAVNKFQTKETARKLEENTKTFVAELKRKADVSDVKEMLNKFEQHREEHKTLDSILTKLETSLPYIEKNIDILVRNSKP